MIPKRLAEIERLLNLGGEYFPSVFEELITFRRATRELFTALYEALAQVAVLIKAVEGARHPDGMANEGDIQFWYERLTCVLAEPAAQARALLDRLQRAEVVVKAAQRDHQICPYDSGDCYVCEALAAWEERTA